MERMPTANKAVHGNVNKGRADLLQTLKKENSEMKVAMMFCTDKLDNLKQENKILLHRYCALSATKCSLEQEMGELRKKFKQEYKFMKSKLIEKRQQVELLQDNLEIQNKLDSQSEIIKTGLEKLYDAVSDHVQSCKNKKFNSKSATYCRKENETTPKSFKLLQPVVNSNISCRRKRIDPATPFIIQCPGDKIIDLDHTFIVDGNRQRLMELEQRNAQCPPHLKTSIAPEVYNIWN